ncbi:MAG: galactokinase [Chloroflexi bacterium]|nr:galactokinase [Chloroflexota bacterium]
MPNSSLRQRITSLHADFREHFGSEPAVVVRAPGRANLLGEHTDYNDGFVLPIAIDRCVLFAAAPRTDRQVVLHALDLDETAAFGLDELAPSPAQPWSNYQRGVAHFLQARGHRLRGMNAALTSDVPIGSGLSSSAAVEVATAFAFRALNNLDISLPDLALVCQQAEHEFAGVPCGIMDQFVSALGRRGHALLLDCRSLAYEHVVLPPGVRVVVCDTGVRRELAGSEYRVRRGQCEEAVRRLQAVLPDIRALRDVTPEQLAEHGALLPEIVHRRARHVVHSTARMSEAVAALRRGAAAAFGQAMRECHASLRDDYEVSCPELEALVDAANEVAGCTGSRLTGAGFGGCTVSLVADGAIAEFEQHVVQRYRAQTGREAAVIVCAAEDGAGVI